MAGFLVVARSPSPSPLLQVYCSSSSSSSESGGEKKRSSSSRKVKESAWVKEQRRKVRREVAKRVMKEWGEARRAENVKYPMWMEDEGDPNWEDDGPEDGWGFRMDELFKTPKIMMKKRREGASSDDSEAEEEMDWDSEEHCEWMVREISQEEWHEVVFEDQRPVMVFVFERYGAKWSECWDALKALEAAVKTFYDKKKIGLRAAKIDAERYKDMGAALRLESVPALLFISSSKLVHRIYGSPSEDQILQAAAHFYHGARRPAFLAEEGLDTHLGFFDM